MEIPCFFDRILCCYCILALRYVNGSREDFCTVLWGFNPVNDDFSRKFVPITALRCHTGRAGHAGHALRPTPDIEKAVFWMFSIINLHKSQTVFTGPRSADFVLLTAATICNNCLQMDTRYPVDIAPSCSRSFASCRTYHITYRTSVNSVEHFKSHLCSILEPRSRRK